jgi:protoporphyrinogen oxidase
MMDREDRPVAIVGGGVSGVTVAVLLAERGLPVVLIEKDERLGGLARSFTYDGFTFDIGPHRFHTYIPQVDRFIRDAMGDELREINRSSTLQFRGRTYPWPIHPSFTLLRFPPGIALAVVRDLLVGFPKKRARSFKDQIINMYGETLYRHFFDGYSTKFLGIAPEQTHPDWAKTGVDRAIIDQRLKIQSLWALVLNVLTRWRKPEMNFLYPEGGCEVFIRNLQGRLEAAGGEVLCGRAVETMSVANDRVEEVRVGDRLVRPSVLVWTGTIHSLARGLGHPPPDLAYLPLVCFNVMLSDGAPHDFQWCYHGADDVVFSRVSNPAAFDPGNTPTDRRSLCVEVTCADTDNGVYRDPEAQVDRVVDDMVKERLLRSGAEVLDHRTERVPWAYPIYELSYRDRLRAFRAEMARYDNLVLAGRLGRFWYNNMDHCIEAGFNLASEIEDRLAGS